MVSAPVDGGDDPRVVIFGPYDMKVGLGVVGTVLGRLVVESFAQPHQAAPQGRKGSTRERCPGDRRTAQTRLDGGGSRADWPEPVRRLLVGRFSNPSCELLPRTCRFSRDLLPILDVARPPVISGGQPGKRGSDGMGATKSGNTRNRCAATCRLPGAAPANDKRCQPAADEGDYRGRWLRHLRGGHERAGPKRHPSRHAPHRNRVVSVDGAARG